MKKVALITILCLSACGTLFNGASQDVKFDSNVKGVDIYVNGMKACKTPCVYPMDRKSSTAVIIAKKPGYEDQQTIVKSELSGVAILNLTFWPSWLTDVATGGMWKYSRDGIYIEMEGASSRQNIINRGYYGRYSENNKSNREIRRFSLYNYGELKAEAMSGKSGEYVKSLAALSGKDEKSLIKTINKSTDEVNLAHTLTGIE